MKIDFLRRISAAAVSATDPAPDYVAPCLISGGATTSAENDAYGS